MKTSALEFLWKIVDEALLLNAGVANNLVAGGRENEKLAVRSHSQQTSAEQVVQRGQLEEMARRLDESENKAAAQTAAPISHVADSTCLQHKELSLQPAVT